MSDAYRASPGRFSRIHVAPDTDMVAMYEDAYKQQPGNEELGSQAFMANVRIGNWKSAQQVCTHLHHGSGHYECKLTPVQDCHKTAQTVP